MVAGLDVVVTRRYLGVGKPEDTVEPTALFCEAEYAVVGGRPGLHVLISSLHHRNPLLQAVVARQHVVVV